MPFQKLPDNKGLVYVPECKREEKNFPVRTALTVSGAAMNAAAFAVRGII